MSILGGKSNGILLHGKIRIGEDAGGLAECTIFCFSMLAIGGITYWCRWNQARNNQRLLSDYSRHEMKILRTVLHPDQIDVSFEDIGGLKSIKARIYELTVIPFLSETPSFQTTKGILLYGPPGTGKTMIAKAIAKASEAAFIPIHPSEIMDRFMGESEKLVGAVFSIATKIQPAIIFVDEIDTIFGVDTRKDNFETVRSEFLTRWDGISSSNDSKVIVLGATNKRDKIDRAILRRMPQSFEVPLPDLNSRLEILKNHLLEEELHWEALVHLRTLAVKTKGYSGSTLKELCRVAKVERHIEKFWASRNIAEEERTEMPLRLISVQDLEEAYKKVPGP